MSDSIDEEYPFVYQIYHPIGKFEYEINRYELSADLKSMLFQCEVPRNELSPKVGSEVYLIYEEGKYEKACVIESNKHDFTIIYWLDN